VFNNAHLMTVRLLGTSRELIYDIVPVICLFQINWDTLQQHDYIH